MSDTKSPRPVDVDALVKGNPKVDAKQLREAQDLVTALREGGVRPPAYGIASPYQRTQQRTKKT